MIVQAYDTKFAFGSAALRESINVRNSAGINIDVTDPDTLFAFFNAKMKDARSALSTLMATQERQNALCQRLQELQAKLTKYQEDGVKPEDPGWDDFIATMKEAKELLGDTSAGREIAGLLAKATGPGEQKVEFAITREKAEAMVKAAGGGHILASPGGGYSVLTRPAAGVEGKEVQSALDTLKAHTSGLQSEGTMTMIRVQQYVEQCSQIVNLCSNVLRKIQDSQMSAINNIRG